MRRSRLVAAAVTVSAALALSACGGSGPSGFTARGHPPLDRSEWTLNRPSAEMTDEAEALILDERGGRYTSVECTPADSLDGTGEFKFECVAEGRRGGGRFRLDVAVFGSESGEPDLGPIVRYTCAPAPEADASHPRVC